MPVIKCKVYHLDILFNPYPLDLILTRGKGLKGKKTAEESQETIDVSEESEPEPEPAKKKTTSRRVVKKKVTLLADDNIISDDPDAALELAKSISQTKVEEAEVARKVHATHARFMTESVSEFAKKNSSARSSKSVVIQATLSALKSKPATSKAKLKGAPYLTLQEQEAADIMQALTESKKTSRRQPCTRGSHEGTSSKPGVSNESIVVSATSSKGTSAKPRVLDEDKDITKEKVILKWGYEQDSKHFDDYNDDAKKDEKDGDADEEGDEEITNASKEEAKNTSEVKDDTKKTKLPPSSSSLSAPSGGVTDWYQEPSTIPTTIPDTTPVIATPTTQTDTTVIPIETPIIAPTIPPSPDYTPSSPNYSPASNTESDPSEDPSSGQIPPLTAVLPFLSSDDDTTDSDTPDIPPSPTHGTLFTEITASSQRLPIIPRHQVMILAPGQPIPHGPSRKRCRSPMTSVPSLPHVSGALSPVHADLLPSPKRVRDIGYLADVEVGPKETRVERVTHPAMPEDIHEPTQEGAREQGHRIVGVESAVAALTERVAELERDNRRLKGTVSVESQRVNRLQRDMSRMQRDDADATILIL
nr:hypothetical protein [Tanacetum cinerariifolium]